MLATIAMRRSILRAILLVMFAAPGLCAQDASSTEPLEVPTRFEVTVEPLAMYFTAGGRFILPGQVRGGRDIDVEHMNVDSPRLSPGLRVDVRAGDWHVTANCFTLTTENRGALSPVTRPIGDLDIITGQPISTSLTFSSADLVVGYRVAQADLASKKDGPTIVRAGVDLFAGARAYWVDIELTNPVGTASTDKTFYEPIVGVGFHGRLYDRYTAMVRLSVGALIGGDKTSNSFEVDSTFSVQLAPHVHALVGYRLLVFDLDDGDVIDKFEYRGSMAGLYVGLRFEF